MTEVSRHEPGSFCWAELATTDDASAKKFYTTLFGWGFEDSPAGPDMIYTTLKKGEKRAGALYKLGPDQKGVPPHWNTYVSVASADQTAGKAKELGGKVLMEPFDVMDFGRMAIVQDQQGAMISLWEAEDAHRRRDHQRAGDVLLGGARHDRHGFGREVLHRPLRLGGQARWRGGQ